MSLEPGTRLDVLVAREGKEEGKRFFTKIGALFVNKDYSCTVKLDALPLTGELYCREPYDKDARPQQANRPKSNPQRGGFGGGFRNRRPPQQDNLDFPEGDNGGGDDGPIG
jgi:hypothetical protein